LLLPQPFPWYGRANFPSPPSVYLLALVEVRSPGVFPSPFWWVKRRRKDPLSLWRLFLSLRRCGGRRAVPITYFRTLRLMSISGTPPSGVFLSPITEWRKQDVDATGVHPRLKKVRAYFTSPPHPWRRRRILSLPPPFSNYSLAGTTLLFPLFRFITRR